MDVTKCRNKLVRYTHDDHWDDDAPAHCEEIDDPGQERTSSRYGPSYDVYVFQTS